VCIVSNGQLLAFAMVVRRKVEELAQQAPMVGLMVQERTHMTAFLERVGQLDLGDMHIVQVVGHEGH